MHHIIIIDIPYRLKSRGWEGKQRLGGEAEVGPGEAEVGPGEAEVGPGETAL